MSNLSILIPARNEMFLYRTVEDILSHAKGDIEVIVGLDGAHADPPLPNDPRVREIYHSVSIGQRAITNEAARLATAKYVMKCDAHCAFDDGFDVKLLADMHDDWTMVPIMRNLKAFDWVCPDGHRRYQSPSGPCTTYVKETGAVCGKETVRDVVWEAKTNPQSKSYCFDSTPHFQYFKEFNKRPGGKGDLTETMSLQGSCFMMTREKYFELNVCDETFGSWGSQGIEVAVKTWLSGGRVVCNQKTWYAHMFRTQGGDFGFPYHMSGRQVDHAKQRARDLFFKNQWDKQTRPLSWLLEKFWPVPGWTDADLASLKAQEPNKFVSIPAVVDNNCDDRVATRDFCESVPAAADTPAGISQVDTPLKIGLVYYTDNRLDPQIDKSVRAQIDRCKNGNQLVTVSLQPIDWGQNIVLNLERGYLTMFKQQLAGIEACEADIVFLTEHDVLYASEHFAFRPPRKDVFYYNTSVWKVDAVTGKSLFYICQQTSGLCAYRSLLLEHYRARVARVEKEGFTMNMGFEPGTHNPPRGIDNYKAESWVASVPNVDIRHRKNLTRSRWSKDQFRNQKYTSGWTESDGVPGWGTTLGRFEEFLNDVTSGRLGT